ncbi:hypothetical protein RYX36_004374 [Vicia faba]
MTNENQMDVVLVALAEFFFVLQQPALQLYSLLQGDACPPPVAAFQTKHPHPPKLKIEKFTQPKKLNQERCILFLILNSPITTVKKQPRFRINKVPIVPSHAVSINDSVAAEEAADDYEFVIRQLVRTRVINVSDISDCPKFDLILLELGADGHVASLFPNHPALDEREERVTFITDSPIPPPERITFTLPVINSASNVAGESKADAVLLAVDEIGPDCLSIPARMVQPANGKLVWFLDKLATTKLEDSDLNNWYMKSLAEV